MLHSLALFPPFPTQSKNRFLFLIAVTNSTVTTCFLLQVRVCPRYIGRSHPRKIGPLNVEPTCHKQSEREEGWNVFTNNSMAWVIENAKGWKKKEEGEGWVLVASQQNMSNCLSTARGQNAFIDQCVSSWSLKLCEIYTFIQIKHPSEHLNLLAKARNVSALASLCPQIVKLTFFHCAFSDFPQIVKLTFLHCAISDFAQIDFSRVCILRFYGKREKRQ